MAISQAPEVNLVSTTQGKNQHDGLRSVGDRGHRIQRQGREPACHTKPVPIIRGDCHLVSLGTTGAFNTQSSRPTHGAHANTNIGLTPGTGHAARQNSLDAVA
jgi:hypothetical protein